MAKTLIEIAESIIEEKGGDEYKTQWLRRYLSNPDNEDEFMGEWLKKQLADSIKKPKKNIPDKIK